MALYKRIYFIYLLGVGILVALFLVNICVNNKLYASNYQHHEWRLAVGGALADDVFVTGFVSRELTDKWDIRVDVDLYDFAYNNVFFSGVYNFPNANKNIYAVLSASVFQDYYLRPGVGYVLPLDNTKDVKFELNYYSSLESFSKNYLALKIFFEYIID